MIAVSRGISRVSRGFPMCPRRELLGRLLALEVLGGAPLVHVFVAMGSESLGGVGLGRHWAAGGSCSVAARSLLEGVLSCALRRGDGGIASLGGTLPKPLPQDPLVRSPVGRLKFPYPPRSSRL